MLTPDGEALLPHARRMLESAVRIRGLFDGSALRGRLRLGVSEDFAGSCLPDILTDFAAQYPAIDLELRIALSGTLEEKLARGELDLTLAKRRISTRSPPRNERHLYRDRLIWLAADGLPLKDGDPVPLILFQPPSITRSAALDALEQAGRTARIVCTCASLSGLIASAKAGLGVLVQPESLAPKGFGPVPAGFLPDLEEVDVILRTSPDGNSQLADAMTNVITERLR